MKKRIFSEMDNGVYRVALHTEDWSEGDIRLMEQFGEPEINVGGTFSYSYDGQTRTKTFGDEFVRLLHGFPYARGFDSRDYGSTGEAIALGTAWKEAVAGTAADSRINAAVTALRANSDTFPTEEVSQV